MLIPAAERLSDVNHEEDYIHLGKARDGSFHHEPIHLVLGFVDARRIDKNDLRLVRFGDSGDSVPGCLGLVGDDGHLLSHNPIDQSRFTDIRPTNDTNKSSFHY
jgi:hypothetical protein